jgi:hypothetical protein
MRNAVIGVGAVVRRSADRSFLFGCVETRVSWLRSSSKVLFSDSYLRVADSGPTIIGDKEVLWQMNLKDVPG